jgi:hypothetical protein
VGEARVNFEAFGGGLREALGPFSEAQSQRREISENISNFSAEIVKLLSEEPAPVMMLQYRIFFDSWH